jgi:aldehyde dehydrogenase (NAD+)
MGDAATAERAVSAAANAQSSWQTTPAPERGEILARAAAILEQRADEVATDLTREEGKTIREARGEVARAASILRFFGGEGTRMEGRTFPAPSNATLIYSRREPLGVVVAISPWNFPIAIPAWKMAPALVAGNAVILKPAHHTPGTASHLVHALVDAGMPRGVLSLVTGLGSVVGTALTDDPRVSGITFTGSVAVGDEIYLRAARRRVRVQLEMGGKNALVVLDDADPVAAARIAAAGGFGLTGQACTATSRVICTPGIRGSFVDAFFEEACRYQPGDGLQPDVLMGPVVSDEQARTNREYIDIARRAGSTTIRPPVEESGLFQAPVIITDVKPGDRLAQEEVFGPVVAVLEVKDLDAAISVVNGTRFGLVAGIVTNNLSAAQRFAREVQVGVVKVNQTTTGVEPNVPFGGVKDSSTNTYREQGSSAIDFFTWTKSVYQGPATW